MTKFLKEEEKGNWKKISLGNLVEEKILQSDNMKIYCWACVFFSATTHMKIQ